MRVALIWESIPDCTDVYVIENPTPEQLSLLESANGKLINQDENTEDVIEIDQMICEKLEYCREDKEGNCIWACCKTEFPVNGPIDKIFWCGYVM